MVEVHPFNDFIPPNASCIILGTFPTHNRNWRFNAYYPGRSNFFWRILSEIYNRPLKHTHGEPAAAERLAICTEKGIALSDTIYKCRRKIATSSKDTDLEVIEKMDVLSLLKKHTGITNIILTGSSGPVSAHSLFFLHLQENDVSFEVTKSKVPIHGLFKIGTRTLHTHTLYSPSGINIGRYKQALEQFRQYLPK